MSAVSLRVVARLTFAVFASIVSAVLVIVAAQLLSASGRVELAAGASAMLTLCVASAVLSGNRRVQGAAVVLFSIFLAVTSIYILMVPFGAYMAWLDLVADGAPTGAISFVFVLLVGLGSSIALAEIACARKPASVAAGLFGLVAWNMVLAGIVLSADRLLYGVGALTVIALGLAAMAAPGDGVSLRTQVGAAARAGIVIALALALAVPAASLHDPGRSRLLDEQLAPWLRDTVLELWPGLPVIANVPGYGGRLESRDLGGRPRLSASPVYELYGHPERLVYMRQEVFEIYDGSSWARSQELPRVAGDGAAGEVTAPGEGASEEGVAAGEGLPRDEAGERPPGERLPRDEAGRYLTAGARGGGSGKADFAVRPDFEVRVVGEFVSELPHPVGVQAFSIAGEGSREFEFAGYATGFRPQSPFTRGTRIRLWADGDPFAFDREGDAPGDERQNIYLKLPDDLPRDVRERAARLDADSNRETVEAIRNALSGAGTYSLNPPRAGTDEDFVGAFLEDGLVGFCVHYASAAVVLARAAGVPARYVTGHIAPPEESEPRTISGLRAHAWAEVYVDGSWEVLEATPAVRSLAEEGRYAGAGVESSDDELTRRQLVALGLVEDPDAKEPASASWWEVTGRSTVLGLGAIAGVIGAALLLGRLFVFGLRRIVGGPRWQLARLAAFGGDAADPERIGWEGWEQAVCRWLEEGLGDERRRHPPHRIGLHEPGDRVPGGQRAALVSVAGAARRGAVVGVPGAARRGAPVLRAAHIGRVRALAHEFGFSGRESARREFAPRHRRFLREVCRRLWGEKRRRKLWWWRRRTVHRLRG